MKTKEKTEVIGATETRSVYVLVTAPFASFVDPLYRADGTSYGCMTPTAAIGLAKNIFWKPEMYWQVEKIICLNPIRYETVLRNFQQDKIKDRDRPMILGVTDNIQQCHTRILKDVAYRIEYRIGLTGELENPKLTIDKYLGQIRDRLKKGQCFSQPYLGCKEFICSFRESTKAEGLPNAIHPELINSRDIPLGRMPIDSYVDKDGHYRYVLKNVNLVKGVIDVKSMRFE